MTFAIPSPGADEPFTLDLIEPQQWYHVYCTEAYPATRADTFNEGWGQTRFAPIKQADGKHVHTYYAASTIRCAMLESVLHDVPLQPPGLFEIDRLAHFHLATIVLDVPLPAVSFHSPFLAQLNLSRSSLIESPAAFYAQTSAWAEAAFHQVPTAAAIKYGSRRDDEGNCIMLFKQRLPAPPFTITDDRPLSSPDLRKTFLMLIRQLHVSEI